MLTQRWGVWPCDRTLDACFSSRLISLAQLSPLCRPSAVLLS